MRAALDLARLRHRAADALPAARLRHRAADALPAARLRHRAADALPAARLRHRAADALPAASQVCAKTDIFEGSIVRSVRRLDEMLTELASAAGVLGDTDLKAKIEDAAASLRRGIMFCASLYI
jgi:hypothetical protein